MATHGAYGIKGENGYKLIYVSFDSHPQILGINFIDCIERTIIDKWKKLYYNCIYIGHLEKLTLSTLKGCKYYAEIENFDQIKQKYEEDSLKEDIMYPMFYSIYPDVPFFYTIDENYIYDKECEYAYIVDIINNTVEFWKHTKRKKIFDYIFVRKFWEQILYMLDDIYIGPFSM